MRFPKSPSDRDTNKIRIGYFSAEFRNASYGYLIAELFERHNRSQFEVTGVFVWYRYKGRYETKIEAAFDKFLDVRNGQTETWRRSRETLKSI